MNPFSAVPPDWTNRSRHAKGFACPSCGGSSHIATDVWINRRSPVYTELHQRKWQEFYACECGCAWWAWSSDRPRQFPADPPNITS
ncbi:hypothetical protein L3556_06640 [Candidatus Synechococcus calcipolaris G9]|uniref:Uncharacterized protein n=1 Tax=Candidatus Synechococcus calcipolaris G9 TaxID=1497997 RepID=A0ABT6EXS6_9SYNE|nr:hypothetical protein [Candidatus Synechococcus calcipolaris]MDG2990612.1 hypothetical protein [Candidatus Synechococcus calcipolaris G9]